MARRRISQSLRLGLLPSVLSLLIVGSALGQRGLTTPKAQPGQSLIMGNVPSSQPFHAAPPAPGVPGFEAGSRSNRVAPGHGNPAHQVHQHQHGGPIKRAVNRAAFLVHDWMIGEPERFHEPPLGYYVNTNMNAQAANGSQHEFTLYRADFYAGTARLTPAGTRRLVRMVKKLKNRAEPLMVEVDPWRPGLAEKRRSELLVTLAKSGQPVTSDQIVVGINPYFGERGNIASEYNRVYLRRSVEAPDAYPLPPSQTAGFSTGGVGGGGGGGQQ